MTVARSLLFALLLSEIFFSFGHAACLSSWDYRKTIIIAEQSGSELTDYQVRIDVTYESDMNTDFSDLRFTLSDGTTEIDYWIEQYDNSSSAIVWVEIPTLTASSSETIYMYYGNSTATTTSSAPDVFIFFDNFETWSGWNAIGSGGVVQDVTTFSSPVLRKQSNNDPDGGWKALGTTVSTFRVIVREQRRTETDGNSYNSYGMENNSNYGYTIYRNADVTGIGEFGVIRRQNGAIRSLTSTNLNQPRDNWYIVEQTRDDAGLHTALLHDDSHVLIGSTAKKNTSYSSFTRFTVRGDYYFYLDWVAVGKYVASEPTLDIQDSYPDIVVIKSVLTISDPVNGNTNPKAIPNGEMLYTLDISNQGIGSTDNNTVLTTDPIPTNASLLVGDINGPGSGPALFEDGSPSSNLSYTFSGLSNATDDIEFSSNNGVTFDYTPVPDAFNSDNNVTHLRVIPKGIFNGSSCESIPSFKLKFMVRIL